MLIQQELTTRITELLQEEKDYKERLKELEARPEHQIQHNHFYPSLVNRYRTGAHDARQEAVFTAYELAKNNTHIANMIINDAEEIAKENNTL